MWVLSWNVFTKHWEKITFSFVSDYQLQITSWLEFGVHVYLSLCEHTWLVPVQALCMLSQSLWSCMCISPVVFRKHCFLGVIHHLWHLKFFLILFDIDLWALRERMFWRPLILEWFFQNLSFLAHQLWFSVLVFIYCKRRLFWW